MRAPIVSYKHQRSEIVTYVGGNVNNTTDIYTGVAIGGTGPQTVAVGAKVYSVNITVAYVNSSASTPGDYSWMVAHYRAGQTVSGSFPSPSSNWSNIGLSNNRNQVIKSYMGVIGTEDGARLQQTVHIKIPRLMQRVREGDTLRFTLNGDPAGTLAVGFLFKSYT